MSEASHQSYLSDLLSGEVTRRPLLNRAVQRFGVEYREKHAAFQLRIDTRDGFRSCAEVAGFELDRASTPTLARISVERFVAETEAQYAAHLDSKEATP